MGDNTKIVLLIACVIMLSLNVVAIIAAIVHRPLVV